MSESPNQSGSGARSTDATEGSSAVTQGGAASPNRSPQKPLGVGSPKNGSRHKISPLTLAEDSPQRTTGELHSGQLTARTLAAMVQLETFYEEEHADGDQKFWNAVMGPGTRLERIQQAAAAAKRADDTQEISVDTVSCGSTRSGDSSEVVKDAIFASNALKVELAKLQQRSLLRMRKPHWFESFRVTSVGILMLLIVVVLGALLAVVFLSYKSSVAGFEQAGSKKTMAQTLTVMGSGLGALKTQLAGWASWDDSWQWMIDGNPNGTFWQSYFMMMQVPYFRSIALIYVTTDGRLFNIQAYDEVAETETTLPREILDVVLPLSKEMYSGVVADPSGKWAYEMATVPLLHTDGTGPAAGTLTALRRPISDVRWSMALAAVCAAVYNINDVPPAFKSDMTALLAGVQHVKMSGALFEFTNETVSIKTVNDRVKDVVCSRTLQNQTTNLIATSVIIGDQLGRPALFFLMYDNRDINDVSNIVSQGSMLGGISVIFLVFVFVYLEFAVVRRIDKLVGSIRAITSQKQFRDRLPEKGHDELQMMSSAINFMLDVVDAEQKKNDIIIMNTLPSDILPRLREGAQISDEYSSTTVVFVDICNFTSWSAQNPSSRIVHVLNSLFSAFDVATAQSGVVKVKTIGDAYLAISGTKNEPNHAPKMISLAMLMLRIVKRIAEVENEDLQVRIGINSGPVSAGVLGLHRFIWDIFGDTVNLAARLEASGEPGRIHVSQATRDLALDSFSFEGPFEIELKGKGVVPTYFVQSHK